MTTTETPLAERLSTGRKSFLHSMFTTALEGGIQYWATVERYTWMQQDGPADQYGYRPEDTEGFNAVLSPPGGTWGVFEGPADGEFLTVDLAVMERGAIQFRRYCHGEIDRNGQPVPMDEWKPLRDGHYWRQWLAQEATHGDQGDSDAEVADLIVQWGLFGKGVYG